jgi:hypothetical protein
MSCSPPQLSDSNAFETFEQTEQAQARIVDEFLDCFDGEWTEM